MTTILFVFCATCSLNTGTLWPPIEYPTLGACLARKTELGGDPPGPVNIATNSPEMLTAMNADLMAFLNADMERQALSHHLVVKCLPRE